MKVIDLLNKIANGEEVPRKVRHGTLYWEYSEKNKDFQDNDGDWVFSCSNYDLVDMLNDEVEIIEEKETKPSEEEIEAFKEQFNIVWNSIKSVLGGILEALQVIDKEELTKKVLEKEKKDIEKINTYGKYTSHNNLHTYMKAIDKDGKEKTFYISEVQKEIINKVNELIDLINELRGKDES